MCFFSTQDITKPVAIHNKETNTQTTSHSVGKNARAGKDGNKPFSYIIPQQFSKIFMLQFSRKITIITIQIGSKQPT